MKNHTRLIALGLTAALVASNASAAFADNETTVFEFFEDDAFDEFEDEPLAEDMVEEPVLFENDGFRTDNASEALELSECAADDLFDDDLFDDLSDCDFDIDLYDASFAEAEDGKLTLEADVNGEHREVTVFRQEDDTWMDEEGHFFIRNEDGTWTDTDGVIYTETAKEAAAIDPEELEKVVEVPAEEDAEGEEEEEEEFEDAEFIFDEDVILTTNKVYASSEVDPFVNESKKAAQSMINGILDVICRDHPDLLPIMGPLKIIIGEMFGLNGSPDPYSVILDKLDEIDKHLTAMENSLKEHLENVVAFDSIGGKFQDVADAISPLELKIGDITQLYLKGKISEEEYNTRLAALYSSGEYVSLMKAISGATNAYTGNTSHTVSQLSIFDAAFNLQCNHVMFSGEAIDCVTPYLFRQLCTYLKGYTLINTVLDAYEAVNGTDSTLSTRKNMFENTGGIVNGKFDSKNPGVFGLYRDFFKRDRFTFVNKSSNTGNHVKLGKEMYAVFGFSETYIGKATSTTAKCKAYTPPVMSDFPLSSEQMKSLAQYASARRMTIFDLLTEDVGFKLYIVPNMALLKTCGQNYVNANPDTMITRPVMNGLTIQFETMTLREALKRGSTYMPTGRQYFTESQSSIGMAYCKTPITNHMQAVNVNKVGASDERLTVADNYDENYQHSAVNPNMLFFQRG